MATPYSLQAYDEVTSTQDLAAASWVEGPLLVVAGRQTAGRGRSQRPWATAPRAVAVSLAFRPAWSSAHWPLIPLIAGLAAAEVIGPGVNLKWPNDILRGEDKLGGILVEGSSDVLVVGCGLNLWWPDPPEGVTARWAEDPGPGAILTTANEWAVALLARIEAGPERWGRSDYRSLSGTIGRRLTWEPGGRGTAVDIGEDGSLIVDTGAGVQRLVAGEVTHLRKE